MACALSKVVVVAPSKVLFKVSPSAALKTAVTSVEAEALINVKLLLASLVKVPAPLETDCEILPTKSTEDENPPVIATGTLAVVADQEVNDSIVTGVLGVEEVVAVLLELLPPPQAPRAIGSNANDRYFKINPLLSNNY